MSIWESQVMRSKFLPSLCPTLLLVVVGGLAFAWSGRLAAQELRVETDIFADKEEKPLSHTVTLFDGSTAYDFVDDLNQIAIFRAPTTRHGGQFILLDTSTQKRTEISLSQIAGLMEKVTTWAGQQKDPLLRFAAQPAFEESFDADSGTLTLRSELWTYEVATIPAEDAVTLARFREFTDWSTRLNSMMNSTPPPGPRLELNAVLEKHGVVPVEIRRTVDATANSLRSVHLFTWRLSQEDHGRLDKARQYLATFEKVSNEQFLAQQAKSDVVRGQDAE
jgi:hypothetical protein